MSRPGSYLDHTAAESFFSGLKKERVEKKIYKNRAAAVEDISDYIKIFYNQIRRHSYLDCVSAVQYKTSAKLHWSSASTKFWERHFACVGYGCESRSSTVRNTVNRWRL